MKTGKELEKAVIKYEDDMTELMNSKLYLLYATTVDYIRTAITNPDMKTLAKIETSIDHLHDDLYTMATDYEMLEYAIEKENSWRSEMNIRVFETYAKGGANACRELIKEYKRVNEIKYEGE